MLFSLRDVMENKVQKWRIWDQGAKTLEDLLSSVNPDERAILFCPEEFEIAWDYDYSKLDFLNSCEIIFGTYRKNEYGSRSKLFETKKLRITLWPDYFLYHAFLNGDLTKTKETKAPTKLFTCMNNRPRSHRLMMMDMLAKHELLSDNYYSWCQKTPRDNYKLKHWNGARKKLDGKFSGWKQHIFPDQMYDSVIDMVTESTTEFPFITEKTFNAVLFKKPFIIYGYPGIHEKMRQMGFKLPSDVIDYSFDKEPDDLKRAEQIALELKRLSTLDFNWLNEQMQPSVTYNYILAYSKLKEMKGIPQSIKEDTYYSKILEDIKCKLDS